MAPIPIRRALVSVSDKAGLAPLAAALVAHGAEILSTGGSARALREAGVAVTEVADHTGFPEILDGRVKTLVPQIHGGILGRRDLPEHTAQMERHGIAPIDLVCVNLYPFEATVAAGAAPAECIENIDIGGPALIRAAAKNHDHVAVLTDPAQYGDLLAELAGHGGTTQPLRLRLAGEAYARTAAYDAAVAAWFARDQPFDQPFPERLTLSGTLRQTLRYGENPHQQAAFYVNGTRLGVASATQVQGKELSYNNLNDTDAAFECVAEFDAPAVVIVKHANPCGVAVAGTTAEAWDLALRCDPVSVFGGIVALNRTLDAATAERIAAIFTEAIIAPDADDDARAILARKKNLRLLLTGGLPDPAAPGMTVRSVAGGFLAQSRDAAARTHGGGAGRPGVRLPRLQAREVERDRLCQGRGDGRHRRRADEPGRQRSHRRMERRRGRPRRWVGRNFDPGQRRGVRCVLPFRRRLAGRHRRRRNRRDPARRLHPRRRGGRGGGRGGSCHGADGDAPLQALMVA